MFPLHITEFAAGIWTSVVFSLYGLRLSGIGFPYAEGKAFRKMIPEDDIALVVKDKNVVKETMCSSNIENKETIKKKNKTTQNCFRYSLCAGILESPISLRTQRRTTSTS